MTEYQYTVTLKPKKGGVHLKQRPVKVKYRAVKTTKRALAEMSPRHDKRKVIMCLAADIQAKLGVSFVRIDGERVIFSQDQKPKPKIAATKLDRSTKEPTPHDGVDESQKPSVAADIGFMINMSVAVVNRRGVVVDEWKCVTERIV